MYNYYLTDSKLHGTCEICGKHASQLFYQRETRDYIKPDGTLSETYADCTNHYGHEECLISIRKDA